MKIVFLEKAGLGEDVDVSIFDKFGEVYLYDQTTPRQIEERIRDVDILFVSKLPMNESTLKNAGKLKLICVTATGTNNIDICYTNARGIVVTNVAGYSTKSVVQHTFACALYLIEKLSFYDHYVKSGEYTNCKAFGYFENQFSELSNKTWGIIGLGAIGRGVADIAQMFGCNVIYYSTSGKNENKDYQQVEFETLCSNADIISIHAPLNKDTQNLITLDVMKKMKSSSILINVGRGGIVNEEDLLDALNNQLIAAAALDVLEKEPMKKDHPLLKIQDSTKLLITPHMAWGTVEARRRLVDELYKNVEAFLEGVQRNVIILQ